eukprot:369870_1
MTTFGIACGYYYEVDKDVISKIAFEVDTDPGWQCESIGIFNGEFSFLKEDSIPGNLSSQTKIAMMDLEPEPPQIPIGNTTIDSHSFEAYKFQDQMFQQQEKTTFEVTKGNSPTTEDCHDTFKGQCSAQSINTSRVIPVNAYKFTWSLSIEHTYPFTSGDSYENHLKIDYLRSTLRLFNVNPAPVPGEAEDIWGATMYRISTTTVGKFAWYKVATNEYWLVTDSQTTDLCSNIENGVSNNEIEWGIRMKWEPDDWGNTDSSNDLYYYPWQDINYYTGANNPPNSFYPNITNIDLNVECERVSLDYCIMNVTDQFVFPNVDDLPRGSTMKSADDKKQLFLLLSSELGETCAERWESVCNEYFDIDGLCTEMVIAPFSCTLVQRKTFLGIVSLAFASSQLVNTILLVIFGFIFSRMSKTTWDNEQPPWQKDIKNHMGKHLEMGQMGTQNEEKRKEENKENVDGAATETVVNTDATDR